MPKGPEWARLTDQDVVLLARAGQEAAYRELIRRYERPVFALLFRMVRDRELAEDLSQETFIKALNAIESCRPELDTLSLDGSPHAETPEAMQATALQIGARQESPLDTVEAKELGGAIEAAISRLRPEYRSCILLRHVEGRAYEEIAEILDLPLGTVKTYIHRARNELRLALAHLRE